MRFQISESRRNLLLNHVVGGLEVLLNHCVSLVGDFDHVVVDPRLLVDFPEARHIHIGDRNHELHV